MAILFVSFLDQSVFVGVESFRAHSLFMMSQDRNLSDPYIATQERNDMKPRWPGCSNLQLDQYPKDEV